MRATKVRVGTSLTQIGAIMEVETKQTSRATRMNHTTREINGTPEAEAITTMLREAEVSMPMLREAEVSITRLRGDKDSLAILKVEDLTAMQVGAGAKVDITMNHMALVDQKMIQRQQIRLKGDQVEGHCQCLSQEE